MQLGKILFIEDDLEFSRQVVPHLKNQGFDVTTVASAAEMFSELDHLHFDCYLVDLTLPDEDGIVLIRKLRARSSAPVVVLSGRKDIDDKLAAFELGAEDYITKPVELRELVARLKAILQHFDTAGATTTDVLYVGNYVLDFTRHQAHDANGQAINLTHSEFSLIWVMAQADGVVFSREKLMDAVTTIEGPATSRAIDNLVSRVRKKIEKDVIHTVSNSGYKCGLPVNRPA